MLGFSGLAITNSSALLITACLSISHLPRGWVAMKSFISTKKFLLTRRLIEKTMTSMLSITMSTDAANAAKHTVLPVRRGAMMLANSLKELMRSRFSMMSLLASSCLPNM